MQKPEQWQQRKKAADDEGDAKRIEKGTPMDFINYNLLCCICWMEFNSRIYAFGGLSLCDYIRAHCCGIDVACCLERHSIAVVRKLHFRVGFCQLLFVRVCNNSQEFTRRRFIACAFYVCACHKHKLKVIEIYMCVRNSSFCIERSQFKSP